MTIALSDITTLMYNTFCSTIGCDATYGLTFLGIFIALIFMLIMFKMEMPAEGVLVIGSFLLILLSNSGFLPDEIKYLPWVAVGIIWAAIVYRFFFSGR